jgi:AmmeMemoRadiSam system protein B
MMEGQWDTPFGPLAVDEEMAAKLSQKFSLRPEDPRRSIPDNTRELQLPLIAHAFPGGRILPLAVAPTTESVEIGLMCARLSQELGRKVLALGSTDLTHYGPSYGFMPRGGGADAERWVKQELDPRVIERMKNMDASGILNEALASHNACCPGAAAATAACVRALDARMSQVAGYSTSRDTMPGDDFVGYVGIVYWR